MNIRTVTSYSSGPYFYEPKIEQSGMTLMITFEGEVRWKGVRYDSPGAFEFVAASHAMEPIGVCGYLVLDSDGELDLLIDQVGGGFPAARYEFEPDGPYTHIALLFSFRIPPEADSLDEVEGVLYQMRVREGDGDSSSRMKEVARRQAAVRAEALDRAGVVEEVRAKVIEGAIAATIGGSEDWRRIYAEYSRSGE